jgi:hypothetical protein
MKIEGAAMKKTSLGLPCAILVAAAAFTNDCRSFAQDLPSCGNKSVAYSPFDEHFASNIAVQPGPVSVLNMGETVLSTEDSLWRANIWVRPRSVEWALLRQVTQTEHVGI